MHMSYTVNLVLRGQYCNKESVTC